MVATDFMNETHKQLRLSKGVSGAFIFVSTLDKNDKYTVQIDGNSTYFEYLLEDLTNGVSEQWIKYIGSDQCFDTAAIHIIEKDNNLDIELEPRKRDSDKEQWKVLFWVSRKGSWFRRALKNVESLIWWTL